MSENNKTASHTSRPSGPSMGPRRGPGGHMAGMMKGDNARDFRAQWLS